jgi:ubiquinone/menaquinone biosynthesis C-methylase UbiE
MVDYVGIKPGEAVLDIATGTGMVALAVAQAVGDNTPVQAIDLSENMLSQAKRNLSQAGFENVTFEKMDGEQPAFDENSFDVITCSYGLFFMPDMPRALTNWLRILKPGGRVIFSSFAPTAFTPMSEIFINNLAEYDITPPQPRWLQLAEEAHCKTLLLEAGFDSPEVVQAQLGYHHSSLDNWWECIQSAGYRGLYEQLPQEHRADFQNKHLADVKQHMTSDGLWMDVMTLFSSAKKPQ